jgi:hypothetical protein
VATVNERLSVHNVTFHGAPLAELEEHWAALGVSRLSILDSQLLDPEFPMLLQRTDYRVEAVYHLFAGGTLSRDPQIAQDALCAVIDAAAGARARTVYLLTGGRGALTWKQAADQFCTMVNPCVEHANRVGVALAIENASSLYADIHLAQRCATRLRSPRWAGWASASTCFTVGPKAISKRWFSAPCREPRSSS